MTPATYISAVISLANVVGFHPLFARYARRLVPALLAALLGACGQPGEPLSSEPVRLGEQAVAFSDGPRSYLVGPVASAAYDAGSCGGLFMGTYVTTAATVAGAAVGLLPREEGRLMLVGKPGQAVTVTHVGHAARGAVVGEVRASAGALLPDAEALQTLALEFQCVFVAVQGDADVMVRGVAACTCLAGTCSAEAASGFDACRHGDEASGAPLGFDTVQVSFFAQGIDGMADGVPVTPPAAVVRRTTKEAHLAQINGDFTGAAGRFCAQVKGSGAGQLFAEVTSRDDWRAVSPYVPLTLDGRAACAAFDLDAPRALRASLHLGQYTGSLEITALRVELAGGGGQAEVETGKPAGPSDADRDGAATAVDCDDADPAVYPGAAERANFGDDDCDGAVDEGQRVTLQRYHGSNGYGYANAAADWDHCFGIGAAGCLSTATGLAYLADDKRFAVYALASGAGDTVMLGEVTLARLAQCFDASRSEHQLWTTDSSQYRDLVAAGWRCAYLGYVKTGASLPGTIGVRRHTHGALTDTMYSATAGEAADLGYVDRGVAFYAWPADE